MFTRRRELRRVRGLVFHLSKALLLTRDRDIKDIIRKLLVDSHDRPFIINRGGPIIRVTVTDGVIKHVEMEYGVPKALQQVFYAGAGFGRAIQIAQAHGENATVLA